eukprot:GFKZ01000713.1.p1 GENE.GFKZ01000713.1~~GFKZ01000713.1.p1  ORF type:complete len:571 (-),score=77.62 GFKZ01000713.1:87-1712(-)
MTPAFLPSHFSVKRPRASRPRPLLCCSSSPPGNNDYLQSKVESHLLASEQTSSLTPSTPPHPPNALPVQLDLLNYHARFFSRRPQTRPTAIRFYRRCIDLNSADGRAWLGLARIHIVQGDIAAARGTFQAGAKASRENAHLLQGWGTLEQKQGAVQLAKKLYEGALRADPEHCASWVALGMWYRKVEKNISKAREMFKKGSEANPRNYYVWHAWGMLERDCRRFKVARECFRRGVEANPNNAATYVNWGTMEGKIGNNKKAVELFEKAHVANPRNTHAYVSHASAAERLGDVEKAVELLKTAIAIRPHDAAPRQSLGLVEWRRGNVERARAEFQDALRVNEGHVPSWNAWAKMERELGLVKRARELYQEAVWAGPRAKYVVRTWHAWAMMEREEGDVEAARRNFRHGLEVDDGNIALLSGLATLEAEEGNMERARDCLERCVRLMPGLKSTWTLYEELEREYGSEKRAELVYERRVVMGNQVEDRLIVSEAMPGDFKAGGMWFDAMELKPTDSAFESVWQSGGDIVTKGKRTKRGRSDKTD